MPRRSVGLHLVETGIRRDQLPGGLVGIEVVGAGRPDRGAADAALACAVDPGEYIQTWRLGLAGHPTGLALGAGRLDRGAAELFWRSVERGCHRALRLRRLHALQQLVELAGQVVERGRVRLGQRFELGVGHQHRLRGVVFGDRDRATERGLLEDRAELVFEAGGGNGRDVDQLAVAVTECQRGHNRHSSHYGQSGHALKLPIRQICPMCKFRLPLVFVAVTMGLRERKKLGTRWALSDAALELALQRGLDNVTREDIANRAGVSLRTFNNYFAGKYEAVAFRQIDRTRQSLAAFRERPAEEPLWSAITEAMLAPLEAQGAADIRPTPKELVVLLDLMSARDMRSALTPDLFAD